MMSAYAGRQSAVVVNQSLDNPISWLPADGVLVVHLSWSDCADLEVPFIHGFKYPMKVLTIQRMPYFSARLCETGLNGT